MARGKQSDKSGKQRSEVAEKVAHRSVQDLKKGGRRALTGTTAKEQQILSGNPKAKAQVKRSDKAGVDAYKLHKKLNPSDHLHNQFKKQIGKRK